MKRRIQWLNGLPYDIKHKAIANIQNQLIPIDYMEEFCSLELCLGSSFVFKDSAEGEAYWNYVLIHPDSSNWVLDLWNESHKSSFRKHKQILIEYELTQALQR
jgi:hypothetical protein